MNMSKIVMGMGMLVASFGVVASAADTEVEEVRNVPRYSVQHYNPMTGMVTPYNVGQYRGNPYYGYNNYNGNGWGRGNGYASCGFNFGFGGGVSGRAQGRGYGNWSHSHVNNGSHRH